ALPPGSPGRTWTFFQRWILSYILVYLFPFPLGPSPTGSGIPGTGWLPAKLQALMHVVVPWVGKAVFGVAITRFPAGSGDTIYNYVELVLRAALALGGAILWTAIRRGRPVSPRTLDNVWVYVRYFLASIMLVYGQDKMLLLQFPALGPD